jgi:hypothetical protein
MQVESQGTDGQRRVSGREVAALIEVLLTEEELDRCWDHAKEIVEYYEARNGKNGSGSYGHNKISSNVIGVKVELAGAKWLRTQLPDALILEHFWDFRSNSGVGDIGVVIDGSPIDQRPIEAKGVTDDQWENVHRKYDLHLRRMVTPKQLKSYLSDDAIILWGTTSRDRVDEDVRLRGWNLASDLERHGERVRTICDNVYLRDDALMRPMEHLPLVLSGVMTVA